MNKVILTGNLCRDNEIKILTNNISVLQNTIAVRNDYKNSKGEYESQFINIVAYRNNAEFINKYTTKGSKILIEGKLNCRSYENKQNQKVYVTDVIVERVELIGTKKIETNENSIETKENTVDEDPFKEFGNEVALSDEDLPF